MATPIKNIPNFKERFEAIFHTDVTGTELCIQLGTSSPRLYRHIRETYGVRSLGAVAMILGVQWKKHQRKGRKQGETTWQELDKQPKVYATQRNHMPVRMMSKEELAAMPLPNSFGGFAACASGVSGSPRTMGEIFNRNSKSRARLRDVGARSHHPEYETTDLHPEEETKP